MADINISMMLNDSTRSIKKRRDEIEALNRALQQTISLAARVSIPGGGSAMPGPAVGRPAASRPASQGRGGVAPSGAEIEDYNRVRGAVGTGAAGRDFANQAQGLGGVVRLYAVFAANIFAVSAAFTRLQEAANFDRLIKASEMMSERTGINLKSLGQNLQAAAGYAISFEEAMQFANLGTSAGIASQQLESLVTIAKGAAAGLGRDVNDAVRRIVQGTAKQEQEILDELGIFIKAKKAYDDYAKKFNITGGADALTAQQKVAAYADAVEKAGAKWKDFAQIDDPFSRFTATGKEALNTLLGIVNDALVPFLRLLADSKGAIMALALAITASLARRALPELKNLFTDLFTYNKARMQAQAAQQRADIAKEMAITSNLIQAEQAKLMALQTAPQVTPGIIRSSFAQGMVSPGRGSNVPGLSEARLTSAIFGTAANPRNLADYQKLEDVEKRINKAVKETIGNNQVKLDQLKALGVVSNTSTLQQITLSTQTQLAAKKIFDAINAQNTSLGQQTAVRAEILRLTEAQAAAQARLAASTPGNVTTVNRFAPAPGTPSPQATAGVIGTAAAAGAAALSTAFSPIKTGLNELRTAFSEVGKNAQQMSAVVGGGMLVNLKQAGIVLSNHITLLRTAAANTALLGIAAFTAKNPITFFAAANAAAAAATGLFGTVLATAFSTIGLAIKGLMAALGPLLLLWTAWELLIKDIVIDEKAKEVKKFVEALKELEQTSKNSGTALSRFRDSLYQNISSLEDYQQAIQVVNNTIQAQIDAINKLALKRKEQETEDRFKKQEEEARKRGEFYSREIFANEELVAAVRLLGTAREEELNAFIQKTREAAAAQADLKRIENQQGPTMFPTPAGLLAGYLQSKTRDYFGIQSPELKAARERFARAQEATVTPLTALQGGGQRRSAVAEELRSAVNSMEGAVTEVQKKLGKLPQYGEEATNETSKVFAKGFEKFAIIFKDGTTGFDPKFIQENYASLYSILEKLAPVSQTAAEGILALQMAQIYGADAADLLRNALTMLPNVTKDLNVALSKYSNASLSYFDTLDKAINSSIIAIIKQNMAISKTDTFNTRIEALRGFSTEQEISSAAQAQRAKVELEATKELQEAEREYQKVVRQGQGTKGEPATQAEINAAKTRYEFAKEQAEQNKQQNILTIDTNTRNKLLESTLKQIGLRYDEINRKAAIGLARAESELRVEQERLRILTEAGGLSEPQLVVRESESQRKQIESTLRNAQRASQIEADRQTEEAFAKFSSGVQGADGDQKQIQSFVQAYLQQLESIKTKQSDINAEAEARADGEREVLRIATAAKIIYAELSVVEKERARAEELRKEQFSTETELLNVLKEELSYKNEMGLITEEAYDREIKALEKASRAREQSNKLLEIEARYKTELNRIAAAERAAITANVQEDAAGNVFIDPAISAEFQKQRTAAGELRNTQVAGATQVYNAQERLREQMNSMGTDQKKLHDIYKGTFESMGDALIEFVRTGKLNFRGLIADMLAQIAKLYVQKTFMGLFGSIFGGGIPSIGYGAGGSGAPMAKGGAFDEGVRKYAKGGMFTNSIVSSPTMFRFAKGTGLMGEAGPEAIMPLKRDSQGNLGVRGTGNSSSNVEVVVNNYGSEKAQTKETTDGRGNKRIEVIIGDITAGEISTNGSRTNRAMQGMFGLQPQLIRR